MSLALFVRNLFSGDYSPKERLMLTSSERNLKKWKRDFPESGPCSYFNTRYRSDYFISLSSSTEFGFKLSEMGGLRSSLTNCKKMESKCSIDAKFSSLSRDKYYLSVRLFYDDFLKERVIFDEFGLNFNGFENKQNLENLFNLLNDFKTPIFLNAQDIKFDGRYMWSHCVDMYELVTRMLGGEKVCLTNLEENVDFVVGFEPTSVFFPLIGGAGRGIWNESSSNKERITAKKFARYKSILSNHFSNKDRDSNKEEAPCDWVTNKYRMTNRRDVFFYIEGCRIPSALEDFETGEINQLNMNVDFRSVYEFTESKIDIQTVRINESFLAVSVYWTGSNGQYLFGSLQRVITNEKLLQLQTCFYALSSGGANGFLSEYKSFSRIKCIHLFDPIEIFERICMTETPVFKFMRMSSDDYFVGTVEIGISKRVSLLNDYSIKFVNNLGLGVHLLHFYYFTGECDFAEAFTLIPGMRPMKKSFSVNKYINKSSQIGRYISDVNFIFSIFCPKKLNSFQKFKNTDSLERALKDSRDIKIVLTEFENYVSSDSVKLKSFIECDLKELEDSYNSIDLGNLIESNEIICSPGPTVKDCSPPKDIDEILSGFSEIGIKEETVRDKIETWSEKLGKSAQHSYDQVRGILEDFLPSKASYLKRESLLFFNSLGLKVKGSEEIIGDLDLDSLDEVKSKTNSSIGKEMWAKRFNEALKYALEPNRKPMKLFSKGEAFDPKDFLLHVPKDRININSKFSKVESSFMNMKNTKENEPDGIKLFNRFEILNLVLESVSESVIVDKKNDNRDFNEAKKKKQKLNEREKVIAGYKYLFEDSFVKRKGGKKKGSEFNKIKFETDDHRGEIDYKALKKRKELKKCCKKFVEEGFEKLKKGKNKKGEAVNMTNVNFCLEELQKSLTLKQDTDSNKKIFNYVSLRKKVYTCKTKSLMKKFMFFVRSKVKQIETLLYMDQKILSKKKSLVTETIFFICNKVRERNAEMFKRLDLIVELERSMF